MRKITLKYYKHSGKYYSDGEYFTSLEFDFDVYGEVRNMKRGEFPGLNGTSLWSGYVWVLPEDGVSAIIDLTWRDE